MSQPTLLLIDSNTLVDVINFAMSNPELQVHIDSNSETRIIHTESISVEKIVDAYAQLKDLAGKNPENRFIKEFREVDALDGILPNDFGNISSPGDEGKIDLTLRALNQMIVETARNAQNVPEGVLYHPESVSAITYVINRNTGDVQMFDSNASFLSAKANILDGDIEDAEDQVEFIVTPLFDRFEEVNELLGSSDELDDDFDIEDMGIDECGPNCSCNQNSAIQSSISIGSPTASKVVDLQDEFESIIKTGQASGQNPVQILERMISFASDKGYNIKAEVINGSE